MRWIVLLLCAAISPVLWVLFSCGTQARCGDGVRGPSPGREGCDDGNTINGDTCSSTCQPVPFLVDGNADDFEWFAYPEPHSTVMAEDFSAGQTLMVWTREYPDCIELRGRILNRYGYPLPAIADPSHAAPCVDGPPEDSFVIATATQASLDPAVVGLADGWAIAYAESRFGSVDIATQVVDSTGKLGFRWIANNTDGGLLLPGSQTAPRLVSNGDGYIVAWVDENRGSDGLHGIWARGFVGSPQNVPVGAPFVIASDPQASLSQVAVAGQGSFWAAAWLRSGPQNEIYIRRYADSSPIDPQPILVATGATSPTLTKQSDGSMMAGYTTDYPFDAEVVRLAAGSSAVDPAPVISFADGADPTERILSLTSYGASLIIARVQNNTPTLEAISATAPYAPMTTTPLEWPNVLDELQRSFDTNVSLHSGSRGLWIAWSGIGAGTLNLGFSIHRLPPEFAP